MRKSRYNARYRSSRQIQTLRRTAAALAVASCFASGLSQANPTNPTVVSGTVAMQQSGNLLSITNSPSAIINWGSFSIGASEITRFIQQTQASAVLNRVVGQDPSAILGALQSNGRVFLINPNGILFGAGSQIDVSGLVASTLNLSDADFLAGRMRFNELPNAGSIVNQGSINTGTGGSVYLVAPDITNSGIITSPQGDVVLAAGKSVELVNPGTPNLRVEINAPDNQVLNLGKIVADSGRVGIYAGLINHSGTIQADSAVVGENGQILLKASNDITLDAGSLTTARGPEGGSITLQSGDTTLVSGTIEAKGTQGKGGTVQVLGNLVGLTGSANIDASGEVGGGTVLVGGDYQGRNPDVQNAYRTYFGTDASIKADAVSAGDGGKVIIWSDDATRAYGSISARGGAQSGDGGFVEVSGKGWLDFNARVDTRAPNGITGTLLLDPSDVELRTTGTLGGSIVGGIFSGGVITPSILGWDTFDANIATSDVIVTTLSGNTSLLAGGISVIDPHTYSSANKLTLLAQANISVGAAITNTGTGGIALYAGWDGISTVAPAVTGFRSIDLSAPISTLGDVTLVASNGISQLSAAAAITANNLLVDAGSSSALLDVATNMVNTLAGKAEDQFLFKNGKSLTIGSVGGVDGITVNNPFGDSTINIQVTSGDLTVNKNITATANGSSVNGSITLGAAGSITVNNSTISATGDGSDSGGTGSVVLNAGTGITLNTSSLSAVGGNGTGDGGAATVSLTAGNTITLNNSSISATGGNGTGSSGGTATISLSGNTGVVVNNSVIGAAGGLGATNTTVPADATVTLTSSAGAISLINSSSITATGGDSTLCCEAGAATISMNAATGITVGNSSLSATGGGGGSAYTGGAASVTMTTTNGNIALNTATVGITGGNGSSNAGTATGTLTASNGTVVLTGTSMSATGGTSLGDGGNATLNLSGNAGVALSGAGTVLTATGGAPGSGSQGIASIDISATLGAITNTGGLLDAQSATAGTGVSLTARDGIGTQANPIRIGSGAIELFATNTSGGDIALSIATGNYLLSSLSNILNSNPTGTYFAQSENGNVTLAGAFTPGTAPLQAGQSVVLSAPLGNVIVDSTGSVATGASFTANAVNVTQNPGGTIAVPVSATASGSISLQQAASYTLGLLQAGTAISVNSTAGAIIDGNGGLNNIFAPSASLSAATGIGSVAAPLQTQVANLTASATSGEIGILNTGNLALTLAGFNGSSAKFTTSGLLSTLGGALAITGDLSLIGNGINIGQGLSGIGNLLLDAGAGNLGITGVSVNGVNVTLTGSNIDIGTVAAIAPTAVSASNALTINASNTLTLQGGAAGAASASADSGTGHTTVTVGANVNVRGGSGPAAFASLIGGPDIFVTAGGAVRMDAGTGVGAYAQIASLSPNSIQLTLPVLATGGYFVNGVENLIYDPLTMSGFLAGGFPAIFNSNLLVSYGVVFPPLLLPPIITTTNNPVDPYLNGGYPIDPLLPFEQVDGEGREMICR